MPRRGDPREQVLRLGLEGAVGHLLPRGAVGHFLRDRVLSVAEQRLGLLHQHPRVGAATRFRAPLQTHDFLVLANRGFDFFRAVLRGGVTDLEPLRLVQHVHGAADVADGQGAAGEAEEIVAGGAVAGGGRRRVLLCKRRRQRQVVARRRRHRLRAVERRLRTGEVGRRGGMDRTGRIDRRQRRHAFGGRRRGRRTSEKRIAGQFLSRRKRAAVGPTQLIEGLPGLLRRIFHRDRPVLDAQRLGPDDQRVGGGQVVVLHRLARPPQQVRRLLPPVVGGWIGSCFLGLGNTCGADEENGVAGTRLGPIGGETQEDGQPAGQYGCGRFQHGSPLLFKRCMCGSTNRR